MVANPRRKIRLGDMLVENNAISEAQLMRALNKQKQTGHKLGRVLVDEGFVTEGQMLDILSHQLKLPYVDLKHFEYDPNTVRLIPETAARRYRAIALKETPDGGLLVGMSDPTDIFGYDELSKILKRSVQQAVVREVDLLTVIDNVYRRTQEITHLAEELYDELSETDFDLAQMGEAGDLVDAPVVKLLQTLFEDAVQIGASDIHIEPDDTVLRIRQRIDGVLQEQVMKEKRIANALVSRLKLMAGLNISEKRLPQDGRFHIKVKNHSIDVRLSTMPIQGGESVVMRLLDQSGDMLNLKQLGMSQEVLAHFRKNIHRPHGMILVTGPTGSGKTTTLYAALSELNDPSKKIITAEDPVEYQLPRINQIQINTKIDLSFARILRSALRQDPDIVLIGEMRDQETTSIALRAAMTGHLVLSTLHTNDAISTVNRLLDMGAQGYLVTTALQAILAQRLVRRICENCKTTYTPNVNESAWLTNTLGQDATDTHFYHGTGCHHCHDSGYHGRIGVFELLELDESMSDALRREDTAEFASRARNSDVYHPFSLQAMDYVRQGITTLEEVFRIAGGIEDLELEENAHHTS